MCAKPGKTVYTFDNKKYILVTTYNNKFDHYKVMTRNGKLKLVLRSDIAAIY